MTGAEQLREANRITQAALAEVGHPIILHPDNPDLYKPVDVDPPCQLLFRARVLGLRAIGAEDRLADAYRSFEHWHGLPGRWMWCSCPEAAS